MLDLAAVGSVTEVTTGKVTDAPLLRRWIAARAAELASRGVGPGTRVVIAHGGTTGFLVDLLACWRRGAAAVCVDPALTPGELANLVGFARAGLVTGAQVGGVEAMPPPAPSWMETDAPPEAVAEDAPALVLFTSGTTGQPKGVVHSFGGLQRRLELNRAQIPPGALAHSLCVLPTHFGHGLIGNCLTPLLAGHDLHLFCTPGVTGAARLGEVIDTYRITFMSSVPALWKVALRVGKPPQSGTLRRIHVGSAPLSAALWRAIAAWGGCETCNLYGITETANWVAGASDRDHAPSDGLVGRMWGGRAAVLTAAGEVAEAGEGELLVDTPSRMVGYLDRPDLTTAALHGNWYRTGDVARIDQDGVICLVGRRKSEINRAGIKVQPEELELLLETNPAVLECCAFGVPDEILGEAIGVALRLAEPRPDLPALRRWCRERLRPDHLPERWFIVEEIAKTTTGKVSRERMRELCLAGGTA